MRQNTFLLIFTLMAFLAGCTSVSHKTAAQITEQGVFGSTPDCSKALQSANVKNEVKWGRIIATPVLTVASVGLLPALLGANAALDYADRHNASGMRVACGYTPLSDRQVITDVATNAGISLAIGAVDLGIGGSAAEVQGIFSDSGQ